MLPILFSEMSSSQKQATDLIAGDSILQSLPDPSDGLAVQLLALGEQRLKQAQYRVDLDILDFVRWRSEVISACSREMRGNREHRLRRKHVGRARIKRGK
jgi:hypothetical protein